MNLYPCRTPTGGGGPGVTTWVPCHEPACRRPSMERANAPQVLTGRCFQVLHGSGGALWSDTRQGMPGKLCRVSFG